MLEDTNKMPKHRLHLVLLSFILSAVLCEKVTAQNHTIFYVKASEDSTCPDTPCETLATYVRNKDMVFRSNTTLMFLNGTHILDTGSFVEIRNVVHLRFIGTNYFVPGALNAREPFTRIQCSGLSGFAFVSVVTLLIERITIADCGAEIGVSLTAEAFLLRTHSVHVTGFEQKAAFFLVNIYDFAMIECSVQNSKGYGVLGVNVLGNSLIRSSTFLANNQYTLSAEVCGYLQTLSNQNSTCEGGNAFFLYEDLLQCPQQTLSFNLAIVSTVFALGVGMRSGEKAERVITRGVGIGVTFSQSSYGVHLTLRNVLSYGNTAFSGANIYIGLYESVDNTTILIENSSSTYGNNILQSLLLPNGVSRSDSSGMYVNYGIVVPSHINRPICTTGEKHQNEIMVIRNSNFQNNNALVGAGMYFFFQLKLDRSIDFTAKFRIEDCNVYGNRGMVGTGMYLSEPVSFEINVRTQVILQNVHFFDNGYTEPIRNLTSLIANNLYSVVQLVSAGNVTFIDCNFLHSEGSALEAFESNILFSGRITFFGNSAFNGGALNLQSSYIYLTSPTFVNITENYAVHNGGGIYVVGRDDVVYRCFFQIEDPSLSVDPGVRLYFDGNYAGDAGNALYGGSVDSCVIVTRSIYIGVFSGTVFDTISEFRNHDNNTSLISSNPYYVCPCEGGVPNCSLLPLGTKTQIPGQTFQLSVVAVGQREGTAPAVVHAYFGNTSTPAKFKTLEEIQNVGKFCTSVTYTVQSSNPVETIIINTEGRMALNATSVIQIELLPCPLGFVLSQGICACDPTLQEHNITCNIDDQTIHRPRGTWINASFTGGEYSDVIFHQNCPYDYCTAMDDDINLNYPDVQCAFNRTGILCGSCQPNLSLALGTSQCQQCSNDYLALLILFALGGIGLVVILFIFNLTISAGTLSGLIFFVNIVRINQSIFFPPGDVSSLSYFIAWLNLDPGSEVCFYNGMDGYAKVWLRFVYPIYVWLIVAAIILISRWSSRIAKLCGSTAVPVLATLLLLSYSKLLRAVIISFSPTILRLPDGSSRTVWYYDGNIDFLQGKHIALFIGALVVLVFFLIPYTLLLLLAPTPCIQANTNHRLLAWVNKLKPFLDAHQSPYKSVSRNWTGVLLVVRIMLSLSVSINLSGDPAINLLVIIITMFLLIAYAWVCGGVYRTWPYNLLECSFYVNLGILATATLYVLKAGGIQAAAAYTSISIALLTFLAVLAIHVYMQLKKAKCFAKVMTAGSTLLHKKQDTSEQEKELQGSTYSPVASHPPTCTVSFAELREPLIDDS